MQNIYEAFAYYTFYLSYFDTIMFQRDWLYEPEFKEWLSGVPGDDLAYCKVCDSDFLCNSKSNVRSHGNGQRHQRLLREHRRNEREDRRTSFSRNHQTNNRSRKRSPASSTSYSSTVQVRERSPMSVASYSSRTQVRERSPGFVAGYSRWSPPQGRRQLSSGNEFATTFIQRNSSVRDDGACFSEMREFLAYSASNGTQATRNVLRRFEY